MVYLFLANGFEEIEALTPPDVLRRAGIEVTTVGIGGVSVTGAHGIRVEADIPDVMYADATPEAVILPGGMPGATNLDGSRVVDAAVRAAAKRGAVLAAICAAPMVLGHKGLLNGKKAVCYPGFETELTGAEIAGIRVVQDGNVLTAAGMGVALEFALTLTEMLAGKEKAAAVRKSILAD